MDLNDPDRDERCEITIIVVDGPNITDVEVTSSPAQDKDTHGVGVVIEIDATFITEVDVDGNPGLGLWVGSNWRGARYVRGSGSDTLAFDYTVQSDDSDADGVHTVVPHGLDIKARLPERTLHTSPILAGLPQKWERTRTTRLTAPSLRLTQPCRLCRRWSSSAALGLPTKRPMPLATGSGCIRLSASQCW